MALFWFVEMKYISFLIFLFSSLSSIANQFQQLVDAPILEVNVVNLNQLKSNQLAIAMPFAKEIILNPEQRKHFEEQVVIKIELVYTKYRTSPTFDQKKLNFNRLTELNKLLPDLFKNPFWDFELISQTNGNSREECNPMFHGFIFTFRPNSSPTTLAAESSYLQQVVDNLIKQSNNENPKDKLSYDLKTRWDDKIGYVHDTIWKVNEVKQIPPPDFFYDHSLYKDSTVLNVFDRNQSWQNFSVVTDVTGSMSPYIAQVFVWLKQQAEKNNAKYFVFFNDGDNKESRKKKPLETGGVYGTKNKGLETVMQTAANCMSNGSGGGERQENDIEAILLAQQEYEAAEEIILVADNFESMRDYKHMDGIKKRVRIIVCGAKNRVNIEYLDLARTTKGSIHTKTSDVYDLDKIKQGQQITIDGERYIFDKGRFHFLY